MHYLPIRCTHYATAIPYSHFEHPLFDHLWTHKAMCSPSVENNVCFHTTNIQDPYKRPLSTYITVLGSIPCIATEFKEISSDFYQWLIRPWTVRHPGCCNRSLALGRSTNIPTTLSLSRLQLMTFPLVVSGFSAVEASPRVTSSIKRICSSFEMIFAQVLHHGYDIKEIWLWCRSRWSIGISLVLN